MPPSSPGKSVNLNKNEPQINPVQIPITITFEPNKYTIGELNIGAFNPFLIINMERGREVHLPNFPPTDLANSRYFQNHYDNTSIQDNRYYVTIYNHPYVLNIKSQFDYTIEGANLYEAYLRFRNWMESGGQRYQDWFKDRTGYRNNALIY